ncbi:hypothetical protein D9M72_495330 [compost metagenome]
MFEPLPRSSRVVGNSEPHSAASWIIAPSLPTELPLTMEKNEDIARSSVIRTGSRPLPFATASI